MNEWHKIDDHSSALQTDERVRIVRFVDYTGTECYRIQVRTSKNGPWTNTASRRTYKVLATAMEKADEAKAALARELKGFGV
jgi:hypothetical protein